MGNLQYKSSVKMATQKLPAMQWYPGDWLKDPGVRALNFFDRGVWFEMINHMHNSEERGVLVLNGKPMSDEMIANQLGLDIQVFNQSLTTMLAYGVAHRRDVDNSIFNKRMVRDEHIRKVRTSAGKLGGNPDLVKQKSTTPLKLIPTPSSSSSTSINWANDQQVIHKGRELGINARPGESMNDFRTRLQKFLSKPWPFPDGTKK